jgi:hypothetical protein
LMLKVDLHSQLFCLNCVLLVAALMEQRSSSD